MRTQRTLRDGYRLSLVSALAATLLVPMGCKQVEDIANKVKGEVADEPKKEEAKEEAKEEPKEVPPEEKSADPKVDPTPVVEAEIEPLPVEELHTGLDLMLGFVPNDKAEFVIGRDPTVVAAYIEQGVRFVDGPLDKLKTIPVGSPSHPQELEELIEAYDKVGEFHAKIGPALESSGLLAKEGMAMVKDGGAEYIVFNAEDPGALKLFIDAIEPRDSGAQHNCKGIEGHEGWNVCSEQPGDLDKYKPNADPAPLRAQMAELLPGVELEDVNLLMHISEDGNPIDAAVSTIPGSLQVTVAVPPGEKDFEQFRKALKPGEAKTLANVSPGAGFIWGHVDPAVLQAGVAGLGGDLPPPAMEFFKSMTGDFVIAGSVAPAGMVFQAGISDPAGFAGVLTLADMVKSEIPTELPDFGNAKVTFEKIAIEGGTNKADALHVGLTGIPEADIMKSYAGLHMDAFAFASPTVFTVAVGPNTEGVGKLLETTGTGPSEDLIAALPQGLGDGLSKNEVSFAMHLPVDFLHGKQMRELATSALKSVPDAKAEDLLALASLLAPFSSASLWTSHHGDKLMFNMSIQGIGNTETEEGKVALAAAHAVVDGAEPEAEFGPIAAKFGASPMAYAYKARAGTDGPGYMIGSGIGGAMAAGLLAVPVILKQNSATLADDLGVKPDDPPPEVIEVVVPKKPKIKKKPPEPKPVSKPKRPFRPGRDPAKDDPKDDPKADPKADPKDDPIVEPDRPKPPKPTPDAPDPKSDPKKPDPKADPKKPGRPTRPTRPK